MYYTIECLCFMYYTTECFCFMYYTTECLCFGTITSIHPQGIIYLVSHRSLLHKIQVLPYIGIAVLQTMCEACMLHGRVIAQALRTVVEIARQEN